MVSINKAYKTRGLTKKDRRKSTYRWTVKKLEKVYMAIVDAGFMLHFMFDLPSTFGEVASLVIGKLCAMSSGVDLVCDTYQNSIKDNAKGSRNNNETTYNISDPLQRIP